MKLADTEVGYKIFDKEVNERRKVVLTPSQFLRPISNKLVLDE